MTDSKFALPDVAGSVDEAIETAEAAARFSGVDIREIAAISDLETVGRLYNDIWQRDAAPPIPTELLRAFAQAGNYVVGAFEGSDLVGACVGFFSAPAGTMHSHIAGVSAAVRSRHVGLAMKLHERAWARRRGVSVIAWTFDPLVARNAWFNVVKLAAGPVEYLPNFYGGMRDGINGSDDSDRLLVHWELTNPAVTGACTGKRGLATRWPSGPVVPSSR